MDESFFKINVKKSIVDISSIKTWNEIDSKKVKSEFKPQRAKVFEKSPFPFDSRINKKVALWVGDLTLLRVKAIVNTTNENFSDKNLLFQKVLANGGPQLRQCIKEQIRGCRTGDVKISKGYDLPARYVIHTVGPKYNQKYHTAAETALFSCYFKVLQLVREKKIESLGLCPINLARRNYPPYEGAHIAFRTVRRFLEKFGDTVDVIIFAVDDSNVGIYEMLMPLYFPRSLEEQENALYLLPKDIGDENGQPVLPERQIRISDKPLSGNRKESSIESSIDLRSGLEASVIVGKSSFAQMHGDIDKRWSNPNFFTNNENSISNEIRRRNRYERLLRKAKLEDLTEIAVLRCLYIGGEDRLGRPVVVFIGKRFKAASANLEKALLYLILTLDRIVQNDYIVIYFHTLTSNENHLSFNFYRYAFDALDRSYHKNLKALYIIHPTFWSRILTWWFATFTASAIKEKIVCLGGIEYLQNVISLKQFQIPSFILDYDLKVNGVRYTIEDPLPLSP